MTWMLVVRWGVLVALATAIAVWDLLRRIIPNSVVIAGLVAGLVLAALTGWQALIGALAGAAAFGGPFTVMWVAGTAASGEGWVGAGDAKAAMALGAVLGMPLALGGLWFGAASGGVLALGWVGRGLWRHRGGLATSWREDGWVGVTRAIASDSVWEAGLPYGSALAAGAILAAALAQR